MSVIIPVFNESATILKVVERVKSTGWYQEIIIVDDGSTDGTTEIIKGIESCMVILKSKNEGKGSALKLGIKRASGDFIMFQDADLEYDQKDYPSMIKPLEDGQADAVIGSRVLSGSINILSVGVITYCSCKLVAFLINVLYGKHFTDYWGGYKAFRREMLQRFEVGANGFEYEIELLCRLLEKNMAIKEVPISYHPRTRGQGKKIKFFPDAFLVVFSIFKCRFFKK